MGNKETGGVVLAALGFVALTLAFKGTWTNVWGALTGHSSSSTGSTFTTPGPTSVLKPGTDVNPATNPNAQGPIAPKNPGSSPTPGQMG